MKAFPKYDLEDPGSLWLDPDRHERVHIPVGPQPMQSSVERIQNFRPVFMGYDEKQAVVEATRCIHCPRPEPCILACPVKNDIPAALLSIEQGKPEEAANIFRLTSNLPEVCGRLCPQEVLCEGSCTVGGYSDPVNIGKLEAYCTDWQRARDGFPKPTAVQSSGRRVAVVGSGPAGLAVAEELVTKGHMATVYEEWPKPGGLLHYGIPSFKLSKDIVAQKLTFLESLGVKFICNTRVGKDVQLGDFRKKFDAIFLGIGAPIGHRIKLPGEDLRGIYQATEFLVRGNLPADDLPRALKGLPEIGENMAVIGGGDTSSDCVRTARRLQAQHDLANGIVTNYYRGTEAEMKARQEEHSFAKEEGIQYDFLASPIRFIGDEHGHIRQIEMQRMRTRSEQQPVQRQPAHIRIPIPGSNFVVPADVAVLAIGYAGDPLIPTKTPQLKTIEPGIFQVESEATGRTTLDGVYAAGDDVRGPDLIVHAIAAGRQAAQAIDEYLRQAAPS